MATIDFERVLLAVDRSPESYNATTLVAALAPPGAEVHVLHGWSFEVTDHGGWWDVETRSEADRLVDGAVSRLRAAGLRATAEVRTAPRARIAHAIAEAAEELDAGLVAMGSRGRSDLGGLFLGSVSHEVLAATDRPLLTVRGAMRPARGPRRVLLALAGSEDVMAGVEAAAAVARRWRAEVIVLHVAELLVPVPAGHAAASHAEALVGEAMTRLASAGIPARGRVIDAGRGVASEIADAVAAYQADLIVMGSRRLGELRGLLLGSTQHNLVHRVDTPVLVTARSRY